MNCYDGLEKKIMRHLQSKGKPLTSSEIACALDEHPIVVHTALACLNRERRVVCINWYGLHYWVEKGV